MSKSHMLAVGGEEEIDDRIAVPRHREAHPLRNLSPTLVHRHQPAAGQRLHGFDKDSLHLPLLFVIR